MLAAFAQTGQAPGRDDLERITRADGADPVAVLAELAQRDVIAFGQAGEIPAAYPFSPTAPPCAWSRCRQRSAAGVSCHTTVAAG